MLPPDTKPNLSEAAPVDLARYVAGNLEKYFAKYPGEIIDIAEGDLDTVKAMSLLNKVRALLDHSANPAEIFQAQERNKARVRENLPLIAKGSFLTGLPIKHLPNSGRALLASEFHTGQSSGNVLPFRLYLSEITAETAGKSLEEILSASHSASYGMKRGTATLVLSGVGELRKKLPRTPILSPLPMSIAWGLPIGTPSTEVTSCIVFHREDEAETLKALKHFPFPVPLYNSSGKAVT